MPNPSDRRRPDACSPCGHGDLAVDRAAARMAEPAIVSRGCRRSIPWPSILAPPQGQGAGSSGGRPAWGQLNALLRPDDGTPATRCRHRNRLTSGSGTPISTSSAACSLGLRGQRPPPSDGLRRRRGRGRQLRQVTNRVSSGRSELKTTLLGRHSVVVRWRSGSSFVGRPVHSRCPAARERSTSFAGSADSRPG